MLPPFVRQIVHLSPFSMFVTCLLECCKCFQKFLKTFRIIMIFFSNNLIFISLFAKLWQMMSKYVIAVIMVLVSNNPSNNLGLSTVPKMLAQFRVCISIEIDYLKYEVDFFLSFLLILVCQLIIILLKIRIKRAQKCK